MSVTLSEQELEDILSYKDQYEQLKAEMDRGTEQWTLSALDDKLPPRVQRAEWISISQLIYMLNSDLDAELSGIVDIGRNPPTRVRASIEDVEVINRILKCLFGTVDLIVEVHEAPPRADVYHNEPPEVSRTDTYRPVRGLNVIVEVIEYGRTNPLDLVRIEFLASLSTLPAHVALQAGLETRLNHINEVVGQDVAHPLTGLHHAEPSTANPVCGPRAGTTQIHPVHGYRSRKTVRTPSTTSQRIGRWISST